jgi:hypothetical protein
LTKLRNLTLSYTSGYHVSDEDCVMYCVPTRDAQDDVCWSADGLLPGLTAMNQLKR